MTLDAATLQCGVVGVLRSSLNSSMCSSVGFMPAWAGGAKARTAKQLPDFVKAFGWCTWDAFYSRVSAEGEGVGVCYVLSRDEV